MRSLIVGVGALGGVIATRLIAAGAAVALATRDATSAAALRQRGLHVTGVGGPASVSAQHVAPLDDYERTGGFDFILLATKAREAIDIAPKLIRLLAAGGTLLPIQNGAVAEIIGNRFGFASVLGGFSNLGATMTQLGVYEQRNAGHLVVGEFDAADSGRALGIAQCLQAGVDVKVMDNMRGAMWTKLVINCAVTTIGAIAGQPMRGYIESPAGRELFMAVYFEALGVALASGATPERMMIDPIPPHWNGRPATAGEIHAWMDQILAAYGDVKASMLQDLERGRETEIDFINGYVVDVSRNLGIATTANAAVVAAVRAITRGEMKPHPELLSKVLRESQQR
jgi:2-dehydropantoate 2-reductase